MKIEVLYFAALRDAANCAQEMLDLPEVVAPNVGSLVRWLGNRYPALTVQAAYIRVAQNEEFVDSDAPLKEGDVIALIPPVAGG